MKADTQQHTPPSLEDLLYRFGATAGAVAIGADPKCMREAARAVAERLAEGRGPVSETPAVEER